VIVYCCNRVINNTTKDKLNGRDLFTGVDLVDGKRDSAGDGLSRRAVQKIPGESL